MLENSIHALIFFMHNIVDIALIMCYAVNNYNDKNRSKFNQKTGLNMTLMKRICQDLRWLNKS